MVFRMEDFVCTFISGAISGAGLVAVGQPFDTVKTKLQTFPELYQKSGALHCAKSIYRSEGIPGLYAGSLPAIMGLGETSTVYQTIKTSTTAGNINPISGKTGDISVLSASWFTIQKK